MFHPNMTIVVMIFIFMGFVILTMKFIWLPIVSVMEERKKKIADGLADSDRAKFLLESADLKARNIVLEARIESGEIIQNALVSKSKIIQSEVAAAKDIVRNTLSQEKAKLSKEFERCKNELNFLIPEISTGIVDKIMQSIPASNSKNTIH